MAKKKTARTAGFDWKVYRPFPIIGVDEVGRGCLAGPVYAAAAFLRSDLHVEHLTDSKLISEVRREELIILIEGAHTVSIASASVEEIDELNILQASLLAMKRAVEGLVKILNVTEAHILIDGRCKIPGLKGFEQTPIIKGDLLASPISAASIVAKVTRDRFMKKLGKEFPHYGFEKHKGYATAEHRQSIQKHGPCSHHRKSFGGVKEFLGLSGTRAEK